MATKKSPKAKPLIKRKAPTKRKALTQATVKSLMGVTPQVVVKLPAGIPQKTLLERAQSLIDGPRAAVYGSVPANWGQTAAIVNGILARKLRTPLTEEDIAKIMIGVKLGRLGTTPMHEDSWLDIGGYTAGVDKLMYESSAPTTHDGSILPYLRASLKSHTDNS